MNDDEFRRQLDRLAKDAPSPDAERATTVRAARRRARIGIAITGVVGAAAIVVGVIAVGVVIDRPRPPAPSVIGPAPTGTAVPPPTQTATPPPEPVGTLAFWSDSPTGGSAQLTVVNVDGSDRQTVGDLSISTSRLSPSPDGSEAVFDHGIGPGEGQLEIIDVRSGEVRTIFAGGSPQSPDWSPRGDQIVFHTEYAALFTVQASGAGEATAVRVEGPDEFLRGLSPSWSPDGRQIAFIDPKSGAIQVITVAGDSPATTIDAGSAESTLDWGAQGIVTSVLPVGKGDTSLALVDPVAGVVELLPDEPGDEFEPALSPDGMFVAFVGNADGQQDIYVMRLSDGRRWRVTDDDRQDRSPVWFPGS